MSNVYPVVECQRFFLRMFWSEDSGFINQFSSASPNTNVTFKPFSKHPPCINDIRCVRKLSGRSFFNSFYHIYFINIMYRLCMRQTLSYFVTKLQFCQQCLLVSDEPISISFKSHLIIKFFFFLESITTIYLFLCFLFKLLVANRRFFIKRLL